MPKNLLKFDSVFAKLFASVMLALVLFALAMVALTHLVHNTSSETRHQILASQVAQNLEPLLVELRNRQNHQKRLESRYILALIRKNIGIYSTSLNVRLGLYDKQSKHAVIFTDNLPPILPPKPSLFSSLFPHNDPSLPTQIQIESSSGYVILYETHHISPPVISPMINLITGTLLLLLIMAGVLWVIAKTMTWRINQLSRQITQFGEGNFSVRVTPVGNDEISTLAHGFNQAAERIESLMNANKLLLAHASHEIRTPITRIRLQIEMMGALSQELSEKTQEKFHKRADAINRDLTGLNDLVESILLVSRLDAGHALEKVETIDMYELIKGEVQHYQQAVFHGSSVSIQGQARLLTHLIRNLLDNAHLHGIPPVEVQLYAIDDKGQPVKALLHKELNKELNKDNSSIEISDNTSVSTNTTIISDKPTETETEKPKNKTSIFSRKKTEETPVVYTHIQIAVIDQGTGIPVEKRQEIFSPFVRLKQEKKGSGLGLSLVSQIVNAHSGTIITDTVDGHTRFLVTLPVQISY